MKSLITGNRITLLRNGAEYFPALESAIESAQHEIYLQTYIFELDETGLRIGDALKRAASRNVLVCLLLDGFGCKNLPESYIHELESSGVEVLVYRPKISPWTLKRSRLRRMHRKMTVVDGRVGFVGGINIIDDFNTPFQMPPRVDYAVQVEGALLPEMRESVLRLWKSLCRVHLKHMRYSTLKLHQSDMAAGNMLAMFLLRDNLWHRREIEDTYISIIQSAKSEILIANAYFLPGLRFRRALRDAAARGVRVKLVLQARVEYLLLDFASHALYSSYLRQGIEICEYHKSFMHSKVAVVDDKWAMVGSSNIDPFSLMLAREANILIKNTSFAKALRLDIQASIQSGGSPVNVDDWEQRLNSKRFLSWVAYGFVRWAMGIIGYPDNPR